MSIAYLPDKVGETEGNTLAITKKDADGQNDLRRDASGLERAATSSGGSWRLDLGKAVPKLQEVRC